VKAPPGAVHAQRGWNHSQPSGSAGDSCPQTVEQALRVAYDVAAAAGLTGMGHRRMVRVVRTYLAERQAEQTFGAWVLAYADPTGDTAVRNVLADLRRAVTA